MSLVVSSISFGSVEPDLTCVHEVPWRQNSRQSGGFGGSGSRRDSPPSRQKENRPHRACDGVHVDNTRWRWKPPALLRALLLSAARVRYPHCQWMSSRVRCIYALAAYFSARCVPCTDCWMGYRNLKGDARVARGGEALASPF